MSSEIFQKDLVRGIPGVKNFSYDIIIRGHDQTSHDNSLRPILERLRNVGARQNREKCLFSVRHLTFFSHTFSENGVSPDPEKVSAIVNCKSPTNIGEVGSFLGMPQYGATFIPHSATVRKPLRPLSRRGAEWRWSETEEKAVSKLNEALTEPGVIAYFDPKKETNVLVDASLFGLGSVLTQKGKVLCYTSRALRDVE